MGGACVRALASIPSCPTAGAPKNCCLPFSGPAADCLVVTAFESAGRLRIGSRRQPPLQSGLLADPVERFAPSRLRRVITVSAGQDQGTLGRHRADRSARKAKFYNFELAARHRAILLPLSSVWYRFAGASYSGDGHG